MNFHHGSKFDVGHKLQFRARMKTVQLKGTEFIDKTLKAFGIVNKMDLQNGIDSRAWPYKNSRYGGE